MPHPTIPSLFQAISSGSIDSSIVPLENSTNGPVNQTLDLIASASEDIKSPTLQVGGETSVRVKQCLVGRRKNWERSRPESYEEAASTADLSYIISLHTHPQAWTQCTPFLNKHFPHGVLKQNEDSTSAAAELVAADVTGTSAAICSALAAELFGLDILAEGIEGEAQNETRFLVLQRRPASTAGYLEIDPINIPRKSMKSLVVLKTHHNISLESIKQALRDAGLAQARFHSRKEKHLWIYFFFDTTCEMEQRIEDLKSKISDSEWWDWGGWLCEGGETSTLAKTQS